MFSIAIGICGIVFVLAASKANPVIRDWLPAPLMLFAYWQGGVLFRFPNQKLQQLLINFDQKRFINAILKIGFVKFLNSYFELAYLLCYPLVPMGLAVLYCMKMQQTSDFYWTNVLLPTYFCHAMVPFTQTLPPWMIAPNVLPKNAIRAFNFWIIKLASIRANTFPSAHVTASIASAFVLMKYFSVMGFIFLWIALSIVVGAVTGRYHYSLDVISALAVVLITFLLIQAWY
jgi:hypothetical protein